ncbi:MAG TPA: DUF177 domain-containing protein [Clostridia bacterium]
MIINIPANSKDQISFAFEEKAEPFLPDYVHPDRPIKITGELDRISGGWRASGIIEYGFEYKCDLCAKDCEYSNSIDFDEAFLVDNNEDQYHFDGNKIDLTQLVIDALMLSLPSRLLCKPDCKGLCPVCGTDRNYNQCDCKIDEVRNNPFDILKDIGGEK